MMTNELLSNNENGRCGLKKVFLKEMTLKEEQIFSRWRRIYDNGKRQWYCNRKKGKLKPRH